MTADRIPDAIGEIYGWRAWKVIGGNEKLPMLASVTHSQTIWHPGHWTHATCGVRTTCTRSSDGSIPGESCTCGLYAGKSREQLVHLGYGSEPGIGTHHPRFIGLVGFAGKVIAGTQGWRAEKGRIVKLLVPHHHWRYVTPLEELYDVEVILENTQRAEPWLGA